MSGKAWSSLASCPNKKNDSDIDDIEDDESGLYASPLTVLLSELCDLVRRLPCVNGKSSPQHRCRGSVVVASSDVLVSLEIPEVCSHCMVMYINVYILAIYHFLPQRNGAIFTIIYCLPYAYYVNILNFRVITFRTLLKIQYRSLPSPRVWTLPKTMYVAAC